MTIIFNPTLTAAGQEAAINASNDGLEVSLTHVSFGTGHYDPTGFEVALLSQVIIVPVSGGARISPTQIRLSASWAADLGTYQIGEVGIWAGALLFAVWSKSDGSVVGVKTPGVDFVLLNDMVLNQVPASSVNVLVDPEESATMAALISHFAADNAHPQYVRHDEFPDALADMWAATVGGTVDAITLTMPVGVEVPAYIAGQGFNFQATGRSTGPVTVAVNGLAAVGVLKNGVDPLSAGDIVDGAVYQLLHDGTNFHISGGVGGGSFFSTHEFVAVSNGQIFGVSYTPDALIVIVNGSTLSPINYIATNTTTVEIPSVLVGDSVLIITFTAFDIANTYSKDEVDLKFSKARSQTYFFSGF